MAQPLPSLPLPDELQEKYQCPYGKGQTPRCLREDNKLQELEEWVLTNSIHNHAGYANIVDAKNLLKKIKQLKEE
jgi:hypothetical protein